MSRIAKPEAEIDEIFRALADPTRRRVMETLSLGSASVTDLAAPFAMALPSFFQHLKVLEHSGLIQSYKQGRVRTYSIAPQKLQLAEGWLERQRTLWEQRLDQLDDYLLKLYAHRMRQQKLSDEAAKKEGIVPAEKNPTAPEADDPMEK